MLAYEDVDLGAVVFKFDFLKANRFFFLDNYYPRAADGRFIKKASQQANLKIIFRQVLLMHL
jgi:hypothetical protein